MQTGCVTNAGRMHTDTMSQPSICNVPITMVSSTSAMLWLQAPTKPNRLGPGSTQNRCRAVPRAGYGSRGHA